jgi:HD-GYP domain-containing protein (c-di-GMP phosphodiesterase class II)
MNRQDRPVLYEAKDIINRLAIAVKTAQTYNMDNQAVVRAVEALLQLQAPLCQAEERIGIELLGECFYVNAARVRHTAQYYKNIDFLAGEFRRRELGSLVFCGGVSFSEMSGFVHAFVSCMSAEIPYQRLSEETEQMGGIEIGPLKQVRQDAHADARSMVRRSYFNAVSSMRSLVTRARDGSHMHVRKTKAVVHSLIDLMMKEEKMLIHMTAIKDYDEYTYYHSVNVGILSLAIGMRLGMGRKQLSELGVSAMLHDIGKVRIPDSVLNKTGPFTDAEWEVMKSHPVEGVDTILGSEKLDPAMLRSAIVSFEHHIYYDGSGYPPVKDWLKTDLFSNIISIADHFDAMTSARVYTRVPKPPELALRILFEGSGIDFDPALIKIFVRLTGCFPVGCMVLLDTREMGVVFYINEALPERPIVGIVIDSDGERVRNRLVDLSETDETGAYLRTIKRTIDPFRYGINVAEYLGEADEVA